MYLNVSRLVIAADYLAGVSYHQVVPGLAGVNSANLCASLTICPVSKFGS